MDECLPPQLDQDSQHGCFEAADATVFFMVLPPVLLQNPKHFALPNITRLDVSNLASTVHAWCEGSKKGYAAAGKTLEYLGLDVAFTLSMNQWVARTPKGVGMFRHTWKTELYSRHEVLFAKCAWAPRAVRDLDAMTPSEQLRISSSHISWLWASPATEVLRIRVHLAESTSVPSQYRFRLGWADAKDLADIQSYAGEHPLVLLFIGDNVLCTSTKLLMTGTKGMLRWKRRNKGILLTWTFNLRCPNFERWSRGQIITKGCNFEQRILSRLFEFFGEAEGDAYGVKLRAWSHIFDELFSGD